MARQENEVRGVLPLALVRGYPAVRHFTSLPYVGHAGICTDITAVASVLLRAAGEWMRKLNAKYVELHNTNWHEADISRSPIPGCTRASNRDFVNLVLPLGRDSNDMWKGLKPKVRNQVRKARKSGLRVEMGGSERLESFYAVFAENMRDLGTPVHSFAMFQNLFAIFPHDTRLFIVYRQHEPVGGAIMLTFKDIVEVAWASSRRTSFRDCPNNLLYGEAMKHACEQGFKEFDFGRPIRSDGSYRFKRQWGADERPLFWQYHLTSGIRQPDISQASFGSRAMLFGWKRLPLAFANKLGPRIRRSISL